MRFSRLVFLLIIYIASPFSMAKNRIVYYEPKVVDLCGVIIILQFPGPPNYESIKNGDADETGGYLMLNKPIDVTLLPKIVSNDSPEKNVKLIQLVVFNQRFWQKIKEGNVVHVTGTLFRALTGHHHARVLLKIKKITVLSKRKLGKNKLHVTNEDQKYLRRFS